MAGLLFCVLVCQLPANHKKKLLLMCKIRKHTEKQPEHVEYKKKKQRKALRKVNESQNCCSWSAAARECVPLSPFISSSHLKPTRHVWADSQTPPQWIYYSATHKGHFFPLPQITSNTQWGHHIIMTYITQYSIQFFSITSHDTLNHKKGKRYFFKKFEWIL